MALGASEFSELFSTTLEKYESTLVDQVLKQKPALNLLREQMKVGHGRSLVIPLRAALGGRTTITDGSGSFATSKDGERVGSAVYSWSKPIVTPTRVEFEDLEQNTGEEQLIDLMEAHKDAAVEDHAVYIDSLFHKTVAAKVAGQFESLDSIVNNDSAREVGGIDPANAVYWKATRREVDLASGTSVRKAFRLTVNDIDQESKSGVEVTHILAGRLVWEEYEDSFDDKVRYTSFGPGETRFKGIQFGNVEVGYDPSCQDRRAYFLSVPTWRIKNLNGNFMKVRPAQPITGTLDFVTPVASILSVGTSERRGNGLLGRPTTAGGAF